MNDWTVFFQNTNRNIFNQCLRSKYLINLVIDNTPKGGNILEAGCGTALLSIILADYGFRVTAMDLDQGVLDYAQGRLTLNNGNLRFVQGDLLKLSQVFDNQHFDTVVSQGVLEHFDDDDIVTIMQEQRKIADTIIFSVPNKWRRLKNTISYGDERLLSNRKWGQLMKRAGFHNFGILGGNPPKFTYFLPYLLFEKEYSFWRRYASAQTIIVCKNLR